MVEITHMDGSFAAKTRNLLTKHSMPGTFIDRFMNDRAHGFPYGEEIERVQQNMLECGKARFSEKEMNVLKWATTLQNVTMVKGPAEYMKVFAGQIEVSRNSLARLFSESSGISSANTVILASYFEAALKAPDEDLYRFHSLTAALFADRILREELGDDGAKRAAWAILFHHENDPENIPANSVARLLRDSIRIHALNEKRFISSINNDVYDHKMSFFDPDIPPKLRIEILNGSKTLKEQRLENPEMQFDAFQSALKTLFIDTSPDMFALPGIARSYLRNNNIFIRLLNRLILSAEQHDQNTELLIDNLDIIRTLLRCASGIGNHSCNAVTIAKGLQAVDDHLVRILDKFEFQLRAVSYPPEVMFLKGRILQIMEKTRESNEAYAKAFLKQGMIFFNQGNLEDAYYYIDMSEEKKPDHFPTLCNKAAILLEMKKYDESFKYYKKAEAAAKEQGLPEPEIVKIMKAEAYLLLEHFDSPYRAYAVSSLAMNLIPNGALPEYMHALKEEQELDDLRKQILIVKRAAEARYAMRN
jgi:tetratricopeptide (TPR) repeat protein